MYNIEYILYYNETVKWSSSFKDEILIHRVVENTHTSIVSIITHTHNNIIFIMNTAILLAGRL